MKLIILNVLNLLINNYLTEKINIMKKTTLLLVALLSFGFAFAQPTTNAPVPTKAAADVKSVYSDAYTNIATNYNPFWGQSGTVNTAYLPTGSGTDFVMAYSNFNYQGTELTQQSLTNMEFLHIDVWTNANPANSILQVSPINNGSGSGETLVTINYTSGTWTSVDIPKSAFTGMTWDSVFQLKFAANGAGSTSPITIYLDNIYFWKTPVAPGSDANLSDLKVNGSTVPGFIPSTITYNVGVLTGSAIPQITLATTSDANATKVINQATSVPGTASVVVTSQNTTVVKTYTVNYVIEGPTAPAPTPPARPVADVKSLFSNAYTNFPVDTWSAPWDDSSIEDVQIGGDDIKKITFTNFLGVDFTSNPFDATTFTHFHMDYWTDATNLVGKVLNPKWSNHNGGSGETSAFLYTGLVTTSGAWVSVDIPLTAFDNAPQTRNALAQFLLTSNLNVVYVDNIYLHKNTVLSNTKFDSASFNVYPNPTNNEWNLSSVQNINSIKLFDISGKQILTLNPNDSSVVINASDFSSGIYFANVSTDNETKIIKLVKN